MIGEAAVFDPAGEATVGQGQGGQVLLEREVAELKYGDRAAEIADVASFDQDARPPLQEVQEVFGAWLFTWRTLGYSSRICWNRSMTSSSRRV